MTERKEILDYGMTLPDVYIDTPFHDDNWVLLRYKKNKRAFAWTYERNGNAAAGFVGGASLNGNTAWRANVSM